MSTLEPKKRTKNRILNLAYCYLSQHQLRSVQVMSWREKKHNVIQHACIKVALEWVNERKLGFQQDKYDIYIMAGLGIIC